MNTLQFHVQFHFVDKDNHRTAHRARVWTTQEAYNDQATFQAKLIQQCIKVAKEDTRSHYEDGLDIIIDEITTPELVSLDQYIVPTDLQIE